MKPVQHASWHIAVAVRKELKLKIKKMVKDDILANRGYRMDQHSCSSKKTPKNRICIDPRDLNKTIKRPNYQMPTIEEVLPCSGDCMEEAILEDDKNLIAVLECAQQVNMKFNKNKLKF